MTFFFKLNPDPVTNQVNHCSSNLSFCLLNACSLRNKSASLCDYVQDCKADIFAITETWLTQNNAVIEGVVLHFYVDRVSTYVDCPPVKDFF